MENLLKIHLYAKSAIDMVCWDILGKATEQPVYRLLGGLLQEKVKLFKVVSRQDADAMASKIAEYQNQGFNQFQMKVGTQADDDIERIEKVVAKLKIGNILAADANCGWKQHEAIRVVKRVPGGSIAHRSPDNSG